MGRRLQAAGERRVETELKRRPKGCIPDSFGVPPLGGLNQPADVYGLKPALQTMNKLRCEQVRSTAFRRYRDAALDQGSIGTPTEGQGKEGGAGSTPSPSVPRSPCPRASVRIFFCVGGSCDRIRVETAMEMLH